MAYLQEQMEILKFDKRLLEINLKNGSLSEEEYKNHLSQLNDLENQAEKLVLDEPTMASEQAMDSMGQESNSMDSSMGGSMEQPQQPITPPNSDPFGSGF